MFELLSPLEQTLCHDGAVWLAMPEIPRLMHQTSVERLGMANYRTILNHSADISVSSEVALVDYFWDR